MMTASQLPLASDENGAYNSKSVLYSGMIALQRAQIGSASLDARILLQHALGVTHEELLADDARVISPQQYHAYQALIEARLKRKPISQLVGKREFWGMDFAVTQHTLDPRPDSETLIEAVLSKLSDRTRRLKVLDLGTGTGCLLLSLLKEYPNATGTGVDISATALAVAQRNAEALGFTDRARFIESCWAEKLGAGETFDIVISNPPYIATAQIATLAPEVAEHEPKCALDGGEDGLDCYRQILAQLPRLLAHDGMAVLEIGAGQEKDVEAIASAQNVRVSGNRCDLQGIMRCLMIKPNNH